MTKEGLLESVRSMISPDIASPEVVTAFLERIKEGSLAREENPESHFGVFFAPIDFVAKKVFIGHHKKSGLWLFNGGHLAEGELPLDTAEREMGEEWGENYGSVEIAGPELLTIAAVNIPQVRCRTHFDIWYFVSTDLKGFTPRMENLAQEFYEWSWMSIDGAKREVTDYSVRRALAIIETKFGI